jgi:transcriptional regulator with XRE-family HTH domain
MANNYRRLRAKMSPEARAKADRIADQLRADMALNELRKARALSQQQIAASLDIKQAAVSKLERRTDMYISTLRNYVEALGGQLEISATFSDGLSVSINQFEELARDSDPELIADLKKPILPDDRATP